MAGAVCQELEAPCAGAEGVRHAGARRTSDDVAGSHRELLDKRGLYAHLVSRQLTAVGGSGA